MFSEAEVVTFVETVSVQQLRGWVRAGWIVPATGANGSVFDELDVARVRLIYELRVDLDLPDDAVPVVLSLLDQVHGPRRELRTLGNAVDAQSREVQSAIFTTYRQLE